MDADQGLWEKSTSPSSGKGVAAPREQEDRQSASSRSSWTSCHGWLGRMTATHTHTLCAVVCARTRVPEGREGRTEEDDDDEEEEERRRKRRRRRRRRRARDTAVYYRGSVPRTASRKLRKKDGGGSEVETRVGRGSGAKGERERPELCEKRRRETRLGFLIYARTREPARGTHGSGGGKEAAK